jgi:hypothetical protein
MAGWSLSSGGPLARPVGPAMTMRHEARSEMVRLFPVRPFLRRQPPQTQFTAAVGEAEIRYGLARMPAGRKRNDLVRYGVRIVSPWSEAYRYADGGAISARRHLRSGGSHQPRLPHRRRDEPREQRVWVERLRLQLRMILHTDEPRMRR